MKYVIINTGSKEKLEEISRHLNKFNVKTMTPEEYLLLKVPSSDEGPIQATGFGGHFKEIYSSVCVMKKLYPKLALNDVIRDIEESQDQDMMSWIESQPERTIEIIYACLYMRVNEIDIDNILDIIGWRKMKDIVAYITEHSKLIELSGRRRRFVSQLRVWDAPRPEYHKADDEFFHTTEGTLLDKDAVENAWGWDGKFVPDGLDRTYAKLRKDGLKISPRDVVIGMFIRKYLWFDKCIEWKHSDALAGAERPIDLNLDYQVVEDSFFGWTGNENHLIPFRNLCSWVVAQGMFLRTAKSKRMGIYWWPTGNAGLPITPKPKVQMHERTFHMHDLTHFVVPDLVYTGTYELPTPMYNWWYVAHRVLTECVTLVVGDMLYVHHAQMDGVEYKTVEDRKIYPIFREVFGDRVDINILPKLIFASIDFGMRGSCEEFMNLFRKYNPKGDVEKFKVSLDNFKNKYAAYLVQDLKWTQKNVEELEQRSGEFRYWWDSIVPRHIADGLGWETVEGVFAQRPKDMDLFSHVDIFNYMGKMCVKKIKKAMSGEATAPKSAKVMRFTRWALGQLLFFSRYRWVPLVRGWQDSFVSLVEKIWMEGTDDLMDLFRTRWEWLLRQCVSQSVLTSEDADLFGEVFPIIDPRFIGYDYEERSHAEIMKKFLESY
jgi:hypothetical protein